MQRGGGDALALTAVLIPLAAVRPDHALLVVAGLAPLGGALEALAGSRTPWTDPLMLAAVTGWLTHRAVRVRAWDATTAALAGLATVLALTSVVVAIGIANDAWELIGAEASYGVLEWLSGTSPPISRPGVPLLHATARFAGAMGLFAMAAEVCRAQPTVSVAATRMLVVGASAVALLSANRFVEVVIRDPDPWERAAGLLRESRISSTIPDLNSAAALLLIGLVLAAAGCFRRGPDRRLAVIAAPVLVAGIWLAGSRTVLALVPAAIAGVLLSPAAALGRRTRAAVLAPLALASGLAVWQYPRTSNVVVPLAVMVRTEMASTTARMVADAPAFGVGLGQYYRQSGDYMSTRIRQYYRAQNAHNQFLQVLGEQGVAGLALFIGLLASAFLPAFRQLLARTLTWHTAALAIALGAFLTAGLTMHPLLSPEANAPFWLALGMLRASGSVTGADAPATRRRHPAIRAAIAGLLFLVASVPWRIHAGLAGADIRGAAFGLSSWQAADAGGRPFRIANGSAELVVDGRADAVIVPLRLAGARAAMPVELRIDGRHVATVLVSPRTWREVRIMLPEHAPRSARLELRGRFDPRVRLEVAREHHLYAEFEAATDDDAEEQPRPLRRGRRARARSR